MSGGLSFVPSERRIAWLLPAEVERPRARPRPDGAFRGQAGKVY